MKKLIIVCVLFFSFSCKKANEVKEVQKQVATEIKDLEECYIGLFKNDSISMTLTIKGNIVVDGILSYNLYEKDKNKGTLVGEIKGDTLFADYTFISEGITSIRQVAFLKKGTNYVEGYGESIEKAGEMVFKETKKLDFNSPTVLVKQDCH